MHSHHQGFPYLLTAQVLTIHHCHPTQGTNYFLLALCVRVPAFNCHHRLIAPLWPLEGPKWRYNWTLAKETPGYTSIPADCLYCTGYSFESFPAPYVAQSRPAPTLFLLSWAQYYFLIKCWAYGCKIGANFTGYCAMCIVVKIKFLKVVACTLFQKIWISE